MRQIANQHAATDVGFASTFEPSTNGTFDGQVLSGYLVPTEAGDYVFYFASGVNSELWLSTNDDPENLPRLASVEGFSR